VGHFAKSIYRSPGRIVSQSEDQPLSEVVPLLVAALVCDVAVADPSTGKKNLIGIFDQVHVSRFPTQRSMSLYMKIADAEGHYKFDVRYVQTDTDKILTKAEGKMAITDRLSSLDQYIPFPSIPIPAPGRYEFQIWANSMFLGSTFIGASQRSTSGG
jgi:hypothetical protein